MRFLGVAAAGIAATLVLAAAASAAPARIAYARDDAIVVMNADGSAAAAVVRQPGSYVSEPAWSPDGATLAFVSSGDDAPQRIYLVGADGSGVRRLTSDGGDSEDLSPAFSPDGRRVAFTRIREAGRGLITELVTVGVDGTGEQVVASERSGRAPAVWAEPAWSPDGSRLVFTRVVLAGGRGFVPALWTLPAGGGARTLLARDAAGASFSPDGTRIAFESIADRLGKTCDGEDCVFNGEIYVMNADGSARTRLTVSRANDVSPAWSPDGARIAFASNRNFPEGDDEEIYSIQPDGGCLTWLTNGTGDSSTPAWQPGAGASSDPGGCGATPRAPSIDVDLAPARAFTAAPLFWLGTETPDHVLLANAEREAGDIRLDYGDCSQFDPSACGEPFSLEEIPACGISTAFRNPRALHSVRGAVIYSRPGRAPRIFTGTTVIDLDADRTRALGIAALLRPFDSADRAARLPAARLPDRVWRHASRRVKRRLVALHARRLRCPRR